MSLWMARENDFLDPIQSHNRTVYKQLEKGDLVEFKRGIFYSHWAVYIGNGEVVHFTGEQDDGIKANNQPHHVFTIGGKARVCREHFWNVVDGCKVYIKNEGKGQSLSPSEIVENALSKIGKIGYNVLWNNCEHFAKWCRFGKAKSDQADNAMTAVGVIAAVGVTAGLLYACSKAWDSNAQKENDEEDD